MIVRTVLTIRFSSNDPPSSAAPHAATSAQFHADQGSRDGLGKTSSKPAGGAARSPLCPIPTISPVIWSTAAATKTAATKTTAAQQAAEVNAGCLYLTTTACAGNLIAHSYLDASPTQRVADASAAKAVTAQAAKTAKATGAKLIANSPMSSIVGRGSEILTTPEAPDLGTGILWTPIGDQGGEILKTPVGFYGPLILGTPLAPGRGTEILGTPGSGQGLIINRAGSSAGGAAVAADDGVG